MSSVFETIIKILPFSFLSVLQEMKINTHNTKIPLFIFLIDLLFLNAALIVKSIKAIS